MNDQLTVKQLYYECAKALKAGYGDKKIAISDDNEGNGFHGMFFGFSLPEEIPDLEDLLRDSQAGIEDIIVLG